MNPYFLEELPDDPPMPREEFLRRELLSFAQKFAILVLVSLVFAAIVYPW